MASEGYKYFLNRSDSASGFSDSINGNIFVDKSMLLNFTNGRISTKEKWICVSRPRRFGKTMNLEMLAAYYTKNINSDYLFKGLKIKNTLNYYKHLNNHNTIQINFSDYFEKCSSAQEGINLLSRHLIQDLYTEFPAAFSDSQVVDNLPLALDIVQQFCGEKFIFLIDEWDCIFRFKKTEPHEHEVILGFLKQLFKDKTYVELVYMTGILPIKKYNTGSALNMFREYSMLGPKRLGEFFGFTEAEMSLLCEKHPGISFDELRQWYDGYNMDEFGHIYNPRSVVEALEEGTCRDYWNQTGGYSELEEYITMNFDGLGETITYLLGGESTPINVVGFSNDLDSFHDKDEVMTALIHLGYLTLEGGNVKIPNREIREEFGNTVKKLQWGVVSKLLLQSRQLLRDTLQLNAKNVEKALEEVHDGMQEFKEYNNEHTLKCVIHLAYYAALDDYELRIEQSAGRGYADCLMIPRSHSRAGIVLELKYDSSAEKALEQIHEKKYIKGFPDYVHSAILVGINYNKNTKRHECAMEKVEF